MLVYLQTGPQMQYGCAARVPSSIHTPQTPRRARSPPFCTIIQAHAPPAPHTHQLCTHVLKCTHQPTLHGHGACGRRGGGRVALHLRKDLLWQVLAQLQQGNEQQGGRSATLPATYRPRRHDAQHCSGISQMLHWAKLSAALQISTCPADKHLPAPDAHGQAHEQAPVCTGPAPAPGTAGCTARRPRWPSHSACPGTC